MAHGAPARPGRAARACLARRGPEISKGRGVPGRGRELRSRVCGWCGSLLEY